MSKFYIISAERANLRPEVNKAYMRELAGHLWLMDVQVKEVDGMYKGVAEKSFYVKGHRPDLLDQLLEIAKQYGQECILAVDTEEHNAAYFIQPDGTTDYVGRFEPIMETQLSQYDGYSRIGDTFFTIKSDKN